MRKYWILTIGLLATLAACSSATPAAPASGPALEGTSWAVTQVKGQAVVAGTLPTMAFADGRVGGTTGCNTYGAGYTQGSNGLVVTQQVTLTAMACTDKAVTAQEQAFVAALPTVTGLRAAGDGVELLDGSRQVVFVLAPIVNKPLEGTAWGLSGVIAKEAVTSPVAGSTVTMSISAGALTGKACNTFRGPVTAANGDFKAGPLMSTRMACPSAELNAQETAVLAALEEANRYAVDGDTLELTGTNGTGLVFTAD